MARIRDFEQDEDKPFGVGTFKLDDGSDYYLDDPERARSFLEEFEKQTDSISTGEIGITKRQEYDNAAARLAEGPDAEQTKAAKLGRPSDPMLRAVAGAGGGEDPDSLMSKAPEPSSSEPELEPWQREQQQAEQRLAEPQAPPVQLGEQELREQEAARRVAAVRGAVSPYRSTPGVDPRRMQREGVAVDQSVTTEGGLPEGMYDAQAEERFRAYQQTQNVAARHQMENETRAAIQAETLRAQAAQLKQSNDAREAELASTQAKYAEDREWLQKETDSFFDKAKPDGERLFKERGTLSNIASAVAQFMGAYAAIVSGQPNFAAKILEGKIDRDVADQMEEYKRGRAKLDSQLHRMAERGMTLDQMKSALKIQQTLAVDKLAKAAAAEEGTKESRQAYEALQMTRQESFLAAEHKFKTDSLGRKTIRADIVQPKAPGRVEKTLLERLKEERDILTTTNDIGYQAAGGAPQERADEREMKRAELGQKQKAATDDAQREYAKQRMKIAPAAEEAQAAAETLKELKKKHGHIPGVGRWDLAAEEGILPGGKMRQQVWSALGSDYAEDAGRARQALKTIEGAAVRANAGTQTEGDVKREAEAMMGPNADESQVEAGVLRLTERATQPLYDLDAAYEGVRPAQDEARDRARLENYKRRRALMGEEY